MVEPDERNPILNITEKLFMHLLFSISNYIYFQRPSSSTAWWERFTSARCFFCHSKTI